MSDATTRRPRAAGLNGKTPWVLGLVGSGGLVGVAMLTLQLSSRCDGYAKADEVTGAISAKAETQAAVDKGQDERIQRVETSVDKLDGKIDGLHQKLDRTIELLTKRRR